MKKWLDKYKEAENGIEGTMGGLTDQGFDYNGAWGGTMQTGGSLPGSVGFMYARTQGAAPSNGPYAKKTKASAQDGIKKPLVKLSPDELKMERLKQYAERASKKEQPVLQSRSSTPDDVRNQFYNWRKAEELLNKGLGYADVITDVMQTGNFIPNPIGQVVGKIGNMLGSGVDAFQAGMETRKGNYGNAAINAASVALPTALGFNEFRRNSKYLQPGQPLYPLSPQANIPSGTMNIPRVNYIEPFTKVKGMTDASLMANRALLGTLGAETAYDAFQNGGEVAEYMELPEITVVGSKDKNTRDFYNNLIDSFAKGKNTNNPYVDQEVMGEYLSVMDLGKKYGFPKVKPETRSGIFKNAAGHYNPITKTIYTNKPKTWVSEMAHHVQMKNNVIDKGLQWLGNDLVEYAKKPIIELKNAFKYGINSSPFDYSDEDFSEWVSTSPYQKEGTVEHEAHSIIEPKLKDEIEQSKKQYKQSPAAKARKRRWFFETEMQNGGEMKFYQEGLDWKPKNISQDGIKVDPMGYWNPDNVGEPVIIPSNEITMEGVYEPLIGISDTGDVQYMEPGGEYEFDGESVIEYPVMQKGGRAPIYVDDPNDPRLRAYQDSLSLYNDARKYYDVITGSGSGSKDKNLRDFKFHPFHKGYTQKNALEELKEQAFDIPKENLKYFDKEEIQNKERIKRISKKTFQSKINPIGTYPLEGFAPAYKKPVQPVQYKKAEPKKEQPVKKEQPKPVERKQNIYEGSPVYSPGIGSGLPSALIGFANQKGDTTYIKPEDYERFAVPKYAKEYIETKKQKNGGWLDKYN